VLREGDGLFNICHVYACISGNNSKKMSYFVVRDPEALTSCPYDKTHMVRNKRMQPGAAIARPHVHVYL